MGRARAVARRQMPGLLHAGGFHANSRAEFLSRGGDFGVTQLARPPALADPVGGHSRFAIRRADVDVAAYADDVVKSEGFEKLEQLDVAEATVGQDRDPDAPQAASPSGD